MSIDFVSRFRFGTEVGHGFIDATGYGCGGLYGRGAGYSIGNGYGFGGGWGHGRGEGCGDG